MDKKEFEAYEDSLAHLHPVPEEEGETIPVEEKVGNSSIKESVYEWMQSIVSMLLCIILIFTFLGRMLGVKGISMVPTLQDKEMMLISNLFYKPQYGDVVVIGRSYGEDLLVKRVIATGGQKVDIDFEAGNVWVDDVLLEEDYIKDHIMTVRGKGDFNGPVYIPDGHVFVMGDNREVSLDSRYKSIGMIDTRLIMGKVYFVVWPLNEIGVIKSAR